MGRKLSELQDKESGIITRLVGDGRFKKRITEMGFVKGQEITVIKNAPLRDPIVYSIMGYEVSLRRREAARIEVESEIPEFTREVITKEGDEYSTSTVSKTIHIALLGNPNCGKTTLFNSASGANEHVGNYAGVTVGTKQAYFKHKGYKIEITDLPGIYSLSPYSPEEVFTRDHLLSNKPDIILNVVDATNLERNLFLTTQLIDLEIPIVMALNMYDELEQKGDQLDIDSLSRMTGIPMQATVAARGKGLEELLDKLIEVYSGDSEISRNVQIHYQSDLENKMLGISKELDNSGLDLQGYPPRFLALKLIEGDEHVVAMFSNKPSFIPFIQKADKSRAAIEERANEGIDDVVVDGRYGFIHGALQKTLKKKKEIRRKIELDEVLTHKYWGYPIFIAIMWLIFQATFVLGAYPMDWIDAGVAWLGDFTDGLLEDGPLKSLLINGVIDGVGGVIVFLPNILILFFCISLLEDTGYMARAAFLMDKLMQRMGLQGKSFIPLIMGFGCNVPAIMATRTLENRKHRLLTMLINPFMSCSARLPVYILIIGAVFPSNQGTILFALYALGILLAIGLSILFKRVMIKTDNIPFVMELPPYRIPTLKASIMHMWFRAMQYLKKMGGIILLSSIIIWALGHYPENVDYSRDYAQLEANIEAEYGSLAAQEQNAEQLESIETAKQAALDSLVVVKAGEHQELSYIGRIGKGIEPLMRPLGYDWKMSVALLTGIAAKEVVISTMGVLYQAEEGADETSMTLKNKLREQRFTSGSRIGEKVFTPLSALSFMVFILIYFPCVAVIAAIKNESGEVKWALFTIVYTTLLAYLVAFVVYQIGSIFI